MIQADRVSMSYPDGTKALRGLSFSVQKGESVALIGANGAGKSSLLLAMVGVLPVTEGSLVLGGIRVEKKQLKALRERVSLLFQNPDDQLFMPTVFEDVAFGPRQMGLPEAEVQRRVGETLSLLGAEKFADKAPYRLSGGEKRTAALCSVLSMRPEILLMDEPTSFLDPGARRRMIRMLGALPETKLIATHDLDFALDLCTRVLVLKDGELAADGPAPEILRNEPLLTACGLELPFRFQKGEFE